MHYKITVLFYCVLTIAVNTVVLSDTRDMSEETGQVDKLKTLWQNESMEADPPDSHEAMNNRENDPNVRTKREFQPIKNPNQEVNLIDSSKKKDISEVDSSNATAGELLLELLVKIAAHPNQWNKVHALLENIDSEIKASKKIIEDLQTEKVTTEPMLDHEEKEQPETIVKKTGSYASENEWPLFQNMNKVSFLNTASPENSQNAQQKQNNYLKEFAYHRVTGRPMYLNKNPKAYIAVSVIAPKPINTRSNGDDLVLEKELRQLKPWTHNQNLKNMASLRSRWVIQRDNINNLVIP